MIIGTTTTTGIMEKRAETVWGMMKVNMRTLVAMVTNICITIKVTTKEEEEAMDSILITTMPIHTGWTMGMTDQDITTTSRIHMAKTSTVIKPCINSSRAAIGKVGLCFTS